MQWRRFSSGEERYKYYELQNIGIIQMTSNDHKQLMHVLNKLAKAERWRKMKKRTGKIKSITKTKSDNIRITFDDKTRVYVLKKNKNLFESAEKLKKNETISVALRTYLGKSYCTKLSIK